MWQRLGVFDIGSIIRQKNMQISMLLFLSNNFFYLFNEFHSFNNDSTNICQLAQQLQSNYYLVEIMGISPVLETRQET